MRFLLFDLKPSTIAWAMYDEVDQVRTGQATLKGLPPDQRMSLIGDIVRDAEKHVDFIGYRQTDYPFIAKAHTDKYVRNIREAAKLAGMVEVWGAYTHKRTCHVPVCQKSEAVELSVFEVMAAKFRAFLENEYGPTS